MQNVAQTPILCFILELQNWFNYPDNPASSKCGAFPEGATNCTAVYRNLNSLLPLEKKTV
jgi:hypothetical protein